MLSDNIIDDLEREELKKLSESLNLSEEDISSIEGSNKINQPTDHKMIYATTNSFWYTHKELLV